MNAKNSNVLQYKNTKKLDNNNTKTQKKILGACLKECVHVLGILNFFRMAERMDYETNFLGPAVPIETIIKEINQYKPQIVAISYRLTPANGVKYVNQFVERIKQNNLGDRMFILGGLPDLIKKFREKDFFDAFFEGGETHDEVLPILKGFNSRTKSERRQRATDLVSRIEFNKPYPILRAHFGLKDLDQTFKGIKELSQSKVLDIISIAPDQAAQEWLQKPDILKEKSKGSGGAPIRSQQDLAKMDELRKDPTGNYPLLRIYSGTQDLIKNGNLFHKTINNAWAAIPVFWYSELDGRGPSKLKSAIKEHFDAIEWHANHDIPVEINDPHQWGLRMAPDHLVVADAYLSAYIAKKLGVKNYVEQMMFNTPPGNSYGMDFARVLAMWDIVQPLIDEDFNIIKETRAGLAYLSPRDTAAKGQLVASTMIQMAIQPDIMHIVSFCEGNHAARPEDIIESCKLVKNVIHDSLFGLPNLAEDPNVLSRKKELLSQARYLLSNLYYYGLEMGYKDPFLSVEFLTHIVEKGIFDAPQLRDNNAALGVMKTRIIDGKCVMVDGNGNKLLEQQRLENLISDFRDFSGKVSHAEVQSSLFSLNNTETRVKSPEGDIR